MNYLAHLLLSGKNEEILFGNFIADHIKGKQLLQLPANVQKGVILHRNIDDFTDHHPITDVSKERLRPFVSKYAPVALDIIYDHYLARNWSLYHPRPLKDFLHDTYLFLDSRRNEMPERLRYMYGYMRKEDWLGNYQYPEGIQRTLNGLSRRTSFPSHLEKAFDTMMEYYEDFGKEFAAFFPELQKHAEGVTWH